METTFFISLFGFVVLAALLAYLLRSKGVDKGNGVNASHEAKKWQRIDF